MLTTKKYSLENLIEYGNDAVNRKVLVNEPGYRMVLLCLRDGQSVPEHANPGAVTVQCIRGRITFHVRSVAYELTADEVLAVEEAAPHRLEAREDSALLVLATSPTATAHKQPEELDLREIPRPQRHPLVFAKLDALAVGDSFMLINDHDPIPLSRQIEDLRPGQAEWEYDQRGPALFRIRVRRIAPPAASDRPVKPAPAVTGINRA